MLVRATASERRAENVVFTGQCDRAMPGATQPLHATVPVQAPLHAGGEGFQPRPRPRRPQPRKAHPPYVRIRRSECLGPSYPAPVITSKAQELAGEGVEYPGLGRFSRSGTWLGSRS